LENRRAEQTRGEDGTSESGDDMRTGCERVNICKYCVHMYENGKMRPVETIPGMWGERNKGEWWRG
jgi:hypothetical protein